MRVIPEIVKKIQEHNNISVDYSYQKSISYSQFSTYLSCPKKWDLIYNKKIDVPHVSVNFSFGTALHETLQQYLDVAFNNSAPEADQLDLEQIFEDKLSEQYKKSYLDNNKTHFSTPEELREFYEDGLGIIQYFKDTRHKYFGKKDWYLVGCEIPITIIPRSDYSNVLYRGYLDIVLYHEPTETFKIIDLKTSGRGWDQNNKNDENKQFQLILYKEFFAKQYNVPENQIEVEFVILKRKIYESKFPTTLDRIQTFSPSSSKIKTKKATDLLNVFIEEVFTKEGKYKTNKEYTANVHKGCKWCPFYKNKTYCKES